MMTTLAVLVFLAVSGKVPMAPGFTLQGNETGWQLLCNVIAACPAGWHCHPPTCLGG